MFWPAGWLLGLAVVCMTTMSDRPQANGGQPAERPRLLVKATDDFEVTGTGDHPSWRQVEWTTMRRRQPESHPYDTRFKMLYSPKGLYFLMEGTDRKLTATMTDDFLDLWNEDVFEVFLWTDERYPVYFEYEISPFNHELPILIPNFGGQFLGWRPWHYERDRVTRKGDEHHRWPERIGRNDRGMARRVLLPVRVAPALAERAAKGGHALARELLPHGL